jgi:hypothetical protein
MSPRRRGRGRGPGGAAVAAAPGAPGAPIAEGEEVVVDAVPAPPSKARASVGPAQAVPAAGRSAWPNPSQAVLRRQPKPRPQPAMAAEGEEPGPGQKAGCTLAQMRRFIKSRPYVPVHELRRRFLIEGIEDEVSPMSTGQGTLFVGLPEREAGFLGELIKAGEVGCEMLLDPTSPAIVGVFPMRPVARQ